MPSQESCDIFNEVEDIEDLISHDDPAPKDRYRNKTSLVPKLRKARARPAAAPEQEKEQSETAEQNFLIGSAAVYVKTWGCAHNSSDSEYMAGQLAAQGFTVTEVSRGPRLLCCTSLNTGQGGGGPLASQLLYGQESG